MNSQFSFLNQQNLPRVHARRISFLTLALCAAMIFLPLSPLVANAATPTPAPTPTPTATEGFDYTVQPGDNWGTVAVLTGLSVSQLKAANPKAVRRSGWLLSGEKLHIPVGTNIQSSVYVVQRGEGWGIIAERFGISVGLLQAANPRSIRADYVLYRGERLLIPGKSPATTASTTVTATTSTTATVTVTVPVTVPVTATVASTPEAKLTVAALTTAQADAKATVAAQTAVAVQATADAQTTADTQATADAQTTADANAATNAQATADAQATATTSATVAAAATNAAKVTADALAVQATAYANATTEAENAAKVKADATAVAAQAATDAATTSTAQAAAEQTAAATTPVATAVPVTATTTLTASEAPTTTSTTTNSEAATNAGAITTTQGLTSTTPVTTTVACPAQFTDYPDAILGVVNSPTDGVEGLRTFLQACGALEENAFTVQDINGDGTDDLLIVYKNPQSTSTTPETDLIILDGGKQDADKTTFTLGHRAKAAGEVHLLATEDLNGDKQPDVAWTVTTCGASTCFDTTEIYSWTGSEWQSWTKDPITMAYAQISLDDVNPEGQGKEIVIKGGVYGSVGAGPQRGRTEVWSSVDGAPYTLQSKTYDTSNCLYHVVLDANEAFLKGMSDQFAAAETLYTKAATDQNLTKCWVRDDEINELRSFSLFRLALIAAHQDKAGVATDLLSSLTATYKDTIYDKVGQVWQASFTKSNDIASACVATNEFAKNNPAATEILADYGYANPSFTANDVCPVLTVEGAAVQTGVTNTVTSTITSTVTSAITTTGATVTETQGVTASQSPSTTGPAATTSPITQTTAITSATVATTTGEAAANNLTACPADLVGYTPALTTVLQKAAGDATTIENWLRGCGALDETRGAFKKVDLNGDDREDLVLVPTIVSDKGFGPHGAQGAVLIYHAQADGTYKLVSQPEIYGQPALLSTQDLNADGKSDLAWTVEGCSTFCAIETQIVSWDGKQYTSTIEPGAVIAVGTAKFEPVADGDPGQGQQLVLQGGMSGTPEGGLAVPHTEIWESVKGGRYQRIRWSYDRTVEGNDCLGLRLVEADVALEASPVLGDKPAIDLYTQSLDPKLKACSIFGMAADQELVLLQGLASFRLLQAQTFSGDLAAAQTTLANLTKGQPDSHYTAAAKQWLEEYTKAKDANAACKAVQPTFEQNEEMWKITDHFGYNHPALAAEQICYKP